MVNLRKLVGLILINILGLASISAQTLAMANPAPLPLFHEDKAIEKESDTEGEGDTTLAVEEQPVFDMSFIPCSDIYEGAWDSMNLDVPEFSRDHVSGCKTFSLVDSTDCEYVHPIHGPMTSDFGFRWYRMHKGVDIDLNTGDSVRAAFDGVIRIAKYNYGGFGHYVVIRHYNGVETLYGHLSKRMVKVNDVVRAGDVIGLGGNTGRSTGSHLHFEVRYMGQALNPNQIISFEEGKLRTEVIEIDEDDFAYMLPGTSEYKEINGRKYHKIRYGDSLWGLSRKYHTSVRTLCRLNGITPKTTLRVGRTIRVR